MPEFFSMGSVNTIDSKKNDLTNQDRCGYESFLATSNEEEILQNLCTRINQHLDKELKEHKKGGSTFSAIIYNPKDGNFSVANLGDSRVYCCLKEKDSYHRFLIALTCDDDPNDEKVAQKYQKNRGNLITNGRLVRALSVDRQKTLAMTRSFGDYDFNPHFRTPIIFSSMHKIVKLLGKPSGTELEVEKFLLASDGFTPYDVFLSKKVNIHAPFESVIHVQFEDNGQFAGFKEIVISQEKSARYAEGLEKNKDLCVDSRFIYKLINLSRDLGSVDDVTIGEIDVDKIRTSFVLEEEAQYSQYILSYVCDGHGPFGHEYAAAIGECVKNFAQKTDEYCRSQIEQRRQQVQNIVYPELNEEMKSLLQQAVSDEAEATAASVEDGVSGEVDSVDYEVEFAEGYESDLADALSDCDQPSDAVLKVKFQRVDNAREKRRD